MKAGISRFSFSRGYRYYVSYSIPFVKSTRSRSSIVLHFLAKEHKMGFSSCKGFIDHIGSLNVLSCLNASIQDPPFFFGWAGPTLIL